MTRIARLTPETMSPAQQSAQQEVVAQYGGINGPYLAYIRSPEFLRVNQQMGQVLRRNRLPGRLRQLLVLATVKHWGAKFPWAVQVVASRKEGLEDAIIDAIDRGAEPKLGKEDAAAYAAARELLQTKRLSDETYARAVAIFGEDTMVDIATTIGFFTMVSLTVNVFDIDPPPR
jgi:4-carboxymuconolactone decarboxylase